MERLDAMVAGVGVLVLVVALAGVVVSGPGPGGAGGGGGARLFQVGFPTTREEMPPAQANIPGDGATTLTLQVTRRNLTEVQFTVDVGGSGPRAAPVSVSVQVQGPGGLRASPATQDIPGPGGPASVTFDIPVPVGTAPNATSTRAASSEAALANMAGLARTTGTGAWTLTITTRGGAVPQANLETFSVSVTPATVAYAATVVPEPANPR